MPEDDQSPTILTPGDGPGESAATGSTTDSPELTALKAENASLRAALDDALSKLHELETVPTPAPKVDEVRLIGEDWSSMTAAEAKAKGCRTTVLCSDGYFVP